jgi:SAM-dependent methyltransferase
VRERDRLEGDAAMDRRQHWEEIYWTKPSDGVSWFQAEPSLSLRLLEGAGLGPASSVIDVGGGDSRLVDCLVRRGVRKIAVLDISRMALTRARERLGPRQGYVTWIEADVTGDWPVPAVDLWHDRAVFHFLTEPGDRARYVARLREAVRPHGAVVIATFALDGPEKCSGLPVVRYSAETLARELGPGFQLVETANELHETPFATVQSFCYSRFSRID